MRHHSISVCEHPSSRGERDDLANREIGELKMEANKPDKTCEQRIDKELEARMEQFMPDISTWGVLKCARHLKSEGREIKTADIEELRSEVLDLIREQACDQLLSVEKVTTYKLCMSWGGPADYFELDWSDDSSAWLGGRYIFQDWFDGARRSISDEQAEQLAELFGIYPDAG